ncbi:expressed unknown protein [Seminavis robusta]|uniref:Uncharacterized protein n=1 Tax=Seminavis robusta TaxID=568900 RepID=A0A9N8DTN2_9STRA|nr:expressed unknown protein [Seminavis robusta]|eukprot:Sro242_g096570.1 n/a (654) ;mRNA; r:20057-22018
MVRLLQTSSKKLGSCGGSSGRPCWHLVLVYLLGFLSAKGLDMAFQIEGLVQMLESSGISISNEYRKTAVTKACPECDCTSTTTTKNSSTAPKEKGVVKTEVVDITKTDKTAQAKPAATDTPPPPPSDSSVETIAPRISASQVTHLRDDNSQFAKIVQTAYEQANLLQEEENTAVTSEQPRQKLDITWWEQESNLTTQGGLRTADRILLGEIYYQANSVFEYGLGESTYMAHHVGVQRYAGIDSDAVWVGMARDKVPPHFRFYLGDIGPTKSWGQPAQGYLPKQILDYQLLPLIVEPKPFDVYMVDGRWRLPSMLASFLHASARGADTTKTTVLIHDCGKTEGLPLRKSYKKADHLLQLVNHSEALLCVYQRKPETTDEQLRDLWMGNKGIVQRRQRQLQQQQEQQSTTAFDEIVSVAYAEAIVEQRPKTPRRTFDIKYWVQHSGLTTEGGLNNDDRSLLGEIYYKANSVFEYGLGESTYIANHVGVPRYAGVDSDPAWVGMARDKVARYFRFYLGDIGPTGDWGYPKSGKLPKQLLDYQLSPLIVEPKPFDVYMVDGRWRLSGMIACFLHASARGADPSKTTVLIHDCDKQPNPLGRVVYKKADHLLKLVNHSGNKLCVYQRKPDTTDTQLQEFWHENNDIILRRRLEEGGHE